MPGKDKEYGDDENSDHQDPTSEADVTENLSEEFIAERHRFLEWVFQNQKLHGHAASRARKKNYPPGIIDDARQKMLEGVLRRYGKGKNKNPLRRVFCSL